jgi:opacity protein-like surface antigen
VPRSPILLLALALAAQPGAAETFVEAGGAISWDDNVGRTARSADARSDLIAGFEGRAGIRHITATDDRLSAAGTLRAEQFHRRDDLSEFAIGTSLGWRRKLGLGATAPWIGASLDGERITSGSPIRDGWRYGAALRAGKRLDDYWNLQVSLGLDRRNGDEDDQELPPNRPTFPGVTPSRRGDVFDLEGTSVGLGLEYTLSDRWLGLLDYSFRAGDVVSSSRANAKVVAAAEAITRDRALGTGRSAYRLDADTHTLRLGLSYALGETSALELGWERQASEADDGIRYDKSIFRVGLLWAP